MKNQKSEKSLTAVILTRNEEDNIKRSLDSVAWCGEIIIIDDNSTDKTVDIARIYQQKYSKINIYSRSLQADFASQRNFALLKVRTPWAIFIDADEMVPNPLKEEIKKVLAVNNNINGFFLKRRDYFLGRWLKYGETADVRLLRLAKKGYGAWQGRAHEVWHIPGNKAELSNSLHHFPHKNIASFLNKINGYSDIVAQYWIEQGRKSSYLQIVFYPFIKFIRNYILKLGFFDGQPGLIMAFMMSLHSFLVRSKVYLNQK